MHLARPKFISSVYLGIFGGTPNFIAVFPALNTLPFSGYAFKLVHLIMWILILCSSISFPAIFGFAFQCRATSVEGCIVLLLMYNNSLFILMPEAFLQSLIFFLRSFRITHPEISMLSNSRWRIAECISFQCCERVVVWRCSIPT